MAVIFLTSFSLLGFWLITFLFYETERFFYPAVGFVQSPILSSLAFNIPDGATGAKSAPPNIAEKK